MVHGGAKVFKDHPVKVPNVNTGAILCAPKVEVREISSGGIVVAEEVRGLEEVNSGGMVVAGNAHEIADQFGSYYIFGTPVEGYNALVDRLDESSSFAGDATEKKMELMKWAMEKVKEF